MDLGGEAVLMVHLSVTRVDVEDFFTRHAVETLVLIDDLFACRTPYVQEQVNIGSGPPGSAVRWFRSVSNKPRFINTITFDKVGPEAPTIVMVHGYGAAQGFFFRNYDALAERFRVLAIDQIGYVICNHGLPISLPANAINENHINAAN